MAGLADFLATYRAARTARAEPELAAFLAAYRRGRLALPAEKPRDIRMVDPEQMRRAFLKLREAACAMRARGDAIDIWSVAGLKRHEVRTASVLAWMLSPRGSHGQSDAVARSLWRRVGAEQVLGFGLNGLETVRTEVCPLGDASDRVDIVLEGADFVVFLEVKIDAPEGPEQLNRYIAAARRKQHEIGKPHRGVAYLAESAVERPPEVLHIRWDDVAAAIAETVRAMPDRRCFAASVFKNFSEHAAKLH